MSDMNVMARIMNSLSPFWDYVKSYVSPGHRDETEEEACDEPPIKRRRNISDCELIGLPKLEIQNASKNRLHRLREETISDDFLLPFQDQQYSFPLQLRRKSRLESPVAPNSRCSGIQSSATEVIQNQKLISIVDDETKVNDCDGSKKNPVSEEKSSQDDKNVADPLKTDKQNSPRTGERASWLDIRTCRMLGRKEVIADKENDIQLLKVVAPAYLEKRNYSSMSPEFQKVLNPAFKLPSRPEMSGGGGSSSLKRPNSNSLSSLSSSQSSFSGHKLQLLDQSIRLDEREKYSELLQSYTRVPVMKQSNSQERRDKSPPISFSFRARKKYGKNVEVVDLTSQADSKEDGNHFTPLSSKADNKCESSTGPPTSELRKKLEKCSVYDISWVDDFTKMYNRKNREAQRRLHEEKIKAALCSRKSNQMLHEILEEKVRLHLRLTEVAVEEGPMPIAEDEIPLPELTPEMEKRISYAFKSGPGGEVLSEAFSLRITRRDLHTLVGTNWLNDEVINFYMNLLIERGKLDNYPSVYCFNTFFYPKLETQGHASLKRWTRRIDVFANELLIVPVHLGVHWCLACINLKDKKIFYYDSMGGNNNTCLQNLMKYLQDESMDKKKQRFDTSGWTTENVKDNPQQMNGSDCGMFSCMYAEYLCRRAKITFSQKDMPYFRRKMAYEILSKRLLL